MAEYAIVEHNLRLAMRVYSAVTELGAVREMPGVSLICSGLDMAVFNPALLSTPVPGPEGDLERRIAVADVFFRSRALPWSFWICEELLDDVTRFRFPRVFRDRGFRATSEPAGMYAEAMAPPSRPLPALDCRLVADAETRNAFADITASVFQLLPATSREIYGPERIWQNGFLGFVGYDRGKPIATAAIVVGAGAIGIYSVGTLPPYRRRGYGETLMRFAVDSAVRQFGPQPLVLQSTAKGIGLYTHLGFRRVARFDIYVTR